MFDHVCPSCGKVHQTQSKATTVCSTCQEKRVQRLREIETIYPSADTLGLVGAEANKDWQIPLERAKPLRKMLLDCGRIKRSSRN